MNQINVINPPLDDIALFVAADLLPGFFIKKNKFPLVHINPPSTGRQGRFRKMLAQPAFFDRYIDIVCANRAYFDVYRPCARTHQGAKSVILSKIMNNLPLYFTAAIQMSGDFIQAENFFVTDPDSRRAQHFMNGANVDDIDITADRRRNVRVMQETKGSMA